VKSDGEADLDAVRRRCSSWLWMARPAKALARRKPGYERDFAFVRAAFFALARRSSRGRPAVPFEI